MQLCYTVSLCPLRVRHCNSFNFVAWLQATDGKTKAYVCVHEHWITMTLNSQFSAWFQLHHLLHRPPKGAAVCIDVRACGGVDVQYTDGQGKDTKE